MVGVVVQQTLLRWNQGQDLRQALLTIAVSVIVADQVIAHFPRTGAVQVGGGKAVSLTWPGWPERRVDLQLWNIDYSLARLVISRSVSRSGPASGSGSTARRDREGHPRRRRRPADDLCARAQHPEDVRDRVRHRRRAGGARRGRRELAGQRRVGQDAQWLLNALVVDKIVGGMGSLLGAAAGALLYAIVLTFSAAYTLPITSDNCCSQYSIVLTFVLIAIVLAFRPQGIFGRAG